MAYHHYIGFIMHTLAGFTRGKGISPYTLKSLISCIDNTYVQNFNMNVHCWSIYQLFPTCGKLVLQLNHKKNTKRKNEYL